MFLACQRNGSNTELVACELEQAAREAAARPQTAASSRVRLAQDPEPGEQTRRTECRRKGRGDIMMRKMISPSIKGYKTETPHGDTLGRLFSPPSKGKPISEIDMTSLRDKKQEKKTKREKKKKQQKEYLRDRRNRERNTDWIGSGTGKPNANRQFVGLHSILPECVIQHSPVINIGVHSSHWAVAGSSGGTVVVSSVTENTSVDKKLIGESTKVLDFDFSSNNQYIASSSVDKTVRVWEISKGHCIRVIYGTSSQLCIRFHPVNNNLLSVGNANKEISVINFSIGRVINKVYFENGLTAMENDHTGQLIFSGDAQGCIYTVSVNSHTGSISRSHKNRSMRSKSLITTVQYRTFSLVARCPVLLVCAQDGNICFFSVALEIKGYLTLLCSLKLAPRLHSIRASFCPLLSLEKGEFIVAGSEDSNVYFYDLTRPKHSCVNKLQGHGSPVIGVAWNYGENLLASSDLDGTVIVWKRAKTS
ncbi:Transcriptional corepressor LEUNIG [Platanthera guangdongensis]|uniref:Transcriptional corepressor LEUNIG n=1 Tax=Platanthera guangdongensis TaxID=2320717 RepID=A0ABR2LX65_9ASPA